MIQAETIDRIVRWNGDGLPVVSLYVHVDPDRRLDLDSQLASLLDQIRSLAYDESLAHEARLSVRGDIDHIQQAAGQKRWKPGAVSIFSCSGRGLFEEIELPRAVHDRVVVDKTAWVRPLLAVLDDYHRSCIVMIDKGKARMWELYQDELREAATVQGETLRKSNYAHGKAEHNVHNRAEELMNRHYRGVAEQLDQMFRSDGYELLVIGGHDHEVPGFVEFLPLDLRARVAGTFTMDPGTATLGDIRKRAGSVLDRYEREEERRIVAEVLELKAMGGLAAVGLSRCLWAGSIAAVQLLLVHDGAAGPGVMCDQSRWLALSGEACPMCGRSTRHVPDIIDELVTAVIDDGGSVEHVQADTELRQHLVAARLRFPLPPDPVHDA